LIEKPPGKPLAAYSREPEKSRKLSVSDDEGNFAITVLKRNKIRAAQSQM
jgi:hypothetical protein